MYDAVLHVQRSVLSRVRPGVSVQQLYEAMQSELASVMREIGLISARDAADRNQVDEHS